MAPQGALAAQFPQEVDELNWLKPINFFHSFNEIIAVNVLHKGDKVPFVFTSTCLLTSYNSSLFRHIIL